MRDGFADCSQMAAACRATRLPPPRTPYISDTRVMTAAVVGICSTMLCVHGKLVACSMTLASFSLEAENTDDSFIGGFECILSNEGV